ncbi:immunoglobulin i-set domain-containing protein [Phthorimaea operculella]|nr:immunoglobulin i-set domain-containing protein [Phthorimaea operculella]
MKEEIDVIKNNIGRVFNSVDLRDVEDFLLVPFKDPDVGPVQHATSSANLVSFINNLAVSGGEECPENTLSAIQKGLEESQPASQIYVFTDAFAKDGSKLADVQSLCHNSSSQVIIILSGSCASSSNPNEGNLDTYYDVASSCRGGILQFDLTGMRKAFDIMREIMKTEWTEVKTYDVTPYTDILFSVDYTTTDLMIIVHGNSRSLNIYDKGENAVNMYKILHTANILIVRFSELTPGSYKMNIYSIGRTSTTIYKRNDLQVHIGFSTRRTNLMKLTSSSPLPGWMNYILITLPAQSTIRLKTLKLNNLNNHQTKKFNLEEEKDHRGQYIISTYFDHDTLFRLTFSGHDTSTYVDVTKTTEIMETQKSLWGPGEIIVPEAKPEVEIIIEPRTTLIDYGSNVTIACRVTGYPEPQISLRNGDYEELPSEKVTLEVPTIYASFASINNFKRNITVFCKAQNELGESSQSLDLFVNSTVSFKVIRQPQDETVEYGAEARLYCEIEAYPEATTNWYHNDTMLSDYNEGNVEIMSENRVLIIKSMTIEDAGNYECEVKNDFDTKSYSAYIDVSGLELPKIKLDQSEIDLQTGDWKELECVSEGKPTPQITWYYRRNNFTDFGALPNGIHVENGNLKISSAQREQTGQYKCEASNALGYDEKYVTIKMKYAPVINNMQETVAANEGESVQLTCDVEASPVATVRWEISKDGIVKDFEERHKIDEHNTLSFHASFNDSGEYRCVAENDLGREEKITRLHIYVEVYIKAPEQKTLRVRSGSSLVLPCKILYGYPPPAVKWEYISTSSIKTVLYRGNSDTNDLYLRNISKDNEGSYICIADNGVTSDSIKISLEVE